MPPANTTFATATAITSLPYDFTQTDINDAGVNYTVYYKFTAPVGSNVIGAWGFSSAGATYKPILRAYLGPADSPVQVLSLAAQNKPLEFPVVASSEYFLEFGKLVNTAGPESLRVRVEVAPTSTVVAGDIAINDDLTGLPTIVVSPSTSFLTRRFYLGTASSDDGNILYPSNQILLADSSDLTFRMYDYDFVQTHSFGPIGGGSQRVSANHTSNKWYIGDTGSTLSGTPSRYAVISGNVLGTVVDLPGGVGMSCLAANNDDTILYWAGSGSGGGAIQRWNIPGGVALADFASLVSGYQNEDIIVLEDGTILISYYKSTVTRDFFVRRYNAAGTILNTYSIASGITGIISKITRALDSSSFWAWTQSSVSGEIQALFQNIRLSDGAVLSSVSHVVFTSGVYDGQETATPSSRFGLSSSCTFFILESAGGTTPPPGEDTPGMFKVTPNKRTDHNGLDDVKIPNPTFRTGLLP